MGERKIKRMERSRGFERVLDKRVEGKTQGLCCPRLGGCCPLLDYVLLQHAIVTIFVSSLQLAVLKHVLSRHPFALSSTLGLHMRALPCACTRIVRCTATISDGLKESIMRQNMKFLYN